MIRRWFTIKRKQTHILHESSASNSALGLCTDERTTPDPIKEISHFKCRLKEFGIEFKQLAASSPHDDNQRLQAIRVAEEIAGNPEMRNYFLTWKRLPLLHDQKTQQQKLTMKRQREYITALTLIFIENYQVLLRYVPGPGGTYE
jgi:hypothetical protein